MRLAVISDIHGNLAALEAVLADIDAQVPDHVLCAGDVVGYGPEPEECLNLVRERDIPCVMGNHEQGVAFPMTRSWFNPQSRKAVDLTAKLISASSLEYISGLPRFLVQDGCRVVHGFPPDEIRTYLFALDADELASRFPKMNEKANFVGHTHELELVTWDGRVVARRPVQEGIYPVGEQAFVCNVGSVGQPRDGDPRAKYVLWDDTRRTVEVRCVPYDIERTVARIREQGFPEISAKRLY
ncbi:MAG: metallophosphoesterase [Deltaproteobacteria bacterium]|nr:metallophosphoesterase [Deltaproteobacteria bacterium]